MNIMYSPEAFGVVEVDTFDLSSGSYEFDYVTVWQSTDDKRTFYIGADSGCSCPSPFEGVSSLADLDRLNPDNPRPQIEEFFRLGDVHYSHSVANIMKGVNDMVLAVKEAQK